MEAEPASETQCFSVYTCCKMDEVQEKETVSVSSVKVIIPGNYFTLQNFFSRSDGYHKFYCSGPKGKNVISKL